MACVSSFIIQDQKGFEDFTLVKEMRNLDEDSGLGERELLKLIYYHYTSKYKLGTIKTENDRFTI